jgi:hypothetical protein
MFSLQYNFHLIKPACPGITSFAAQIVREQLGKDIDKNIQRSGGLHTFTAGMEEVSHAGYGVQTFSETAAALQEYQPLAWNILIKLAIPHHQRKKNSSSIRHYRPPEMVSQFSKDVVFLNDDYYNYRS